MQDWGFNRGVQFKFGVPHFPEGQVCVERLIGEIKKELKHVIRGKTFTFGQLDSVLAECSYLVNTRPLQLTPAPGAGGEDGFICPNDLMMGRSDRAPPVGEFEPTSLTKKVKFMRDIVLQFWDRWSVSYFQRLVKFHKWRAKGQECKTWRHCSDTRPRGSQGKVHAWRDHFRSDGRGQGGQESHGEIQA